MNNRNQVDTELLVQIKEVLSSFPEYWEQDTLLRNRVAEDIRSYKKDVIEALLSNELIKDTYSVTLDAGIVFKVEDFISMLRYKNYWENSYTKYSNEIGLTSEGRYLKYNTDVVLDFPHKDGVLEGGMTKEDEGQNEIYYHNVLAKEEIDTLLAPKILSNVKKFNENGQHNITSFMDTDNLILKGNNLVALHTLKEKFNGKVKMIYIDPPYNTGNDTFKYNDSFNRSTWLTFMKNRLSISRELLREDGLIFVQCDDNEQAYLKVLMDDIFSEQNFVNVVTIKTKIAGVSGSSEGKSLRDATEFINIFAKNKNEIYFNPVHMKTELYEHIQNYRNEGKSWKYTTVITDYGNKELILQNKKDDFEIYKYDNVQTMSVNQFAKKHKLTEKEVYEKHADKITRSTNAQSSVRQTVIDLTEDVDSNMISIVYKPIKGKNKDKWTEVFYTGKNRNMVMFLNDIIEKDGEKFYYKERISTLWDDIQYNNLRYEGDIQFSSGKKPELILKRIIELTTDINDLIIDFFMGSATTQAVAHKMNRQYIGVEQMDYINEVSVPRLQKVIEGEQGGISEDVEWQGGGSFVYAELHSLNEQYVKEIQAANDEESLNQVLSNMKDSAYLNFKVDLEQVTTDDEGYESLTLEEKKDVLTQVLDMNQLYLNYSEIEDTQHGISEDVKAFNDSFYQEDGDE